MSGSTMVMAPAMQTSSTTSSPSSPGSISRSQSVPELLSLSHFSSYRDAHDDRQGSRAQYDYNLDWTFDSDFKLDTTFSLPDVQKPLTSSFVPDKKGANSDSDSDKENMSAVQASDNTAHWRPSGRGMAREERSRLENQAIRRSRAGSLAERRAQSWFPGSKASKDVDGSEPSQPSPRAYSWFPGSRDKSDSAQHPSPLSSQTPSARPATAIGGVEAASERRSTPTTETRKSTVQDSFANFAKRSWLQSSAEPSAKRRPNSAKGTPPNKDDSDSSTLPKPLARSFTEGPSDTKPAEPSKSSKPLNRASSYFSKMRSKQSISLKKLANSNNDSKFSSTVSDNSCASSVTSSAPAPSNTTADTRTYDTSTTITDASSAEMPPALPRQNNDPLWSAFKNLEIEHKSFHSKSTPQRLIQVQTILSPFLRGSMYHRSTKQLSPEDVERRCTILNKWWTSILDVLEGTGMGSIPSMDRHIMLDALSEIIARPEWRQTTTSFLPLSDRSSHEQRGTGASADDSDEAFLAESAQHNVRTTFIGNLARQMAFVVDKMAMRNVPLVLISFAAKTCAYAFFFVPGVADVLVRLWGLGPELLRRAADGMGLPRAGKGKHEDIVAMFPPKLAAFGWTSSRSMWSILKQIPLMPVMISRINWMGPWISRWKGRDTDLLFAFFKQYHILADEFMPSNLPLTEKARAPGFVLVHAQLLSIIDDTIHLQSALGGPAIMDPLPGADASAMAMPLPPPNLMKGMAENSLVMLLKEILSDESPEIGGAKHTFAEACVAMTKAAVKRTSQFDTAACFTLCDFLEEALTIYDSFDDPVTDKKYTDWPFWIDVFKKIFGSLNTMAEVRVLSFLYTIWDTVAKDPRRKAALCLNWLLTEEVFNTYFNHWCPMVRAYYQRLLCWRICRCDGDPDEVDQGIYMVVAARLKATWSHYLYLKQAADESGRFPPSTAPMFPTPGKKFMIIRQEVNQPQPGLFVNFDNIAKTPGSDTISSEDLVDSTSRQDNSKKKKSLLGKVLSSISGAGNGNAGGQNRLSWDEEFVNARRETAEARSRASAPAPISTSGSNTPDSACSSPLYEEQKFVFKFFLAFHQPASPPRERMLTRPRLPGPAQNAIGARARSTDTPPTSMGAQKTSLDRNPPGTADSIITSSSAASSIEQAKESVTEQVTQPTKPIGICAKNAPYTGRSLSEWHQVTWECNTFSERRQEEGVQKLGDVEVPLLGVESFRKMGG